MSKTRFPTWMRLNKKNYLFCESSTCITHDYLFRKGYWMGTQPSGYISHTQNFHFLLLLLSKVLIVHFNFFKLRKVQSFRVGIHAVPLRPPATTTLTQFFQRQCLKLNLLYRKPEICHESQAEINFRYYRKTCKAKSNMWLIPGKVWELVQTSCFSYRVAYLLRPPSCYRKHLEVWYLGKE